MFCSFTQFAVFIQHFWKFCKLKTKKRGLILKLHKICLAHFSWHPQDYIKNCFTLQNKDTRTIEMKAYILLKEGKSKQDPQRHIISLVHFKIYKLMCLSPAFYVCLVIHKISEK